MAWALQNKSLDERKDYQAAFVETVHECVSAHKIIHSEFKSYKKYVSIISGEQKNNIIIMNSIIEAIQGQSFRQVWIIDHLFLGKTKVKMKLSLETILSLPD